MALMQYFESLINMESTLSLCAVTQDKMEFGQVAEERRQKFRH
jgi:hypothetical protein